VRAESSPLKRRDSSLTSFFLSESNSFQLIEKGVGLYSTAHFVHVAETALKALFLLFATGYRLVKRQALGFGSAPACVPGEPFGSLFYAPFYTPSGNVLLSLSPGILLKIC